MDELYNGYDIFEVVVGWMVSMSNADGYDETGPFATKEAAMEWVDQQVKRDRQPDGDPECDMAAQAALEHWQRGPKE